ncbi:hypothetical protein BpHYR1_042328 [Brachionus plicatilis]|uniref:Uncharacterized protein n=1 Tax=Brachionus plicatilis TaxID=10195 RepID=A0A3M7SUG2_BRAPC|nr:hypothetical protein BpHYR1_042328 [Brachionus plicatilis]
MSAEESSIEHQNSKPNYYPSPQFSHNNHQNNVYGKKRKFPLNQHYGTNMNRNKFFRNPGQFGRNEKEFDVKDYYDKSMVEDPWAHLASDAQMK